MAQGYNLTVQLNLQGPKNLNNIVNNINQKLSNIQATVNVKTSPQTAKALQNIANASKQVQQSADDAAGGMEKFGKSAGLAIKRFGAFTAATAGFYAITRATTESLQRFIEYDRQLTRVAQVTNTAKSSLGGLANEITSLSTSLGASSASLAEVAVTLSQAGLSAQQTTQALKALALTTLAPTFNDINQTVEGSIALMKQFSITTQQLEGALGSINAVAGQFAVESSDIITAIQRTGGVFAAASNGVSQGTDALNEFIAVFTSVRATTRESAETIATGLRTIFTRIQREDTLEALKEFGVELQDLEGKFVGPYVAIQRLAEGLRDLDPRDVQFSSLVEELGGFRQVGKVIPLIQQFTTAQQALNVAQQGSGSLAKDAAIGQQSLGVQIAKVQQEFDALIRSIGQTSEFRQFISLSLDLASALIQIADAVKPLIPALTALGAVKLGAGIPAIARGFRRGIGATGYNTGGLVRGPGGIDKVEARLTEGEYVIRKKAVQSIGADRLAEINRTGKMPGYKSGGPVNAETLPSAFVQRKITRAGTAKEYADGTRINAKDRINFDIQSLPIDASPKIGNTEFEQRVAATVGGQWKGGNYPVDVMGPQGPIEVRNRKEFTSNPELADKLARLYGDSGLSNKMQLDNINLGTIYVAYNTGKLDEKKRQQLEEEGRSQKIAPKSALRGAKKKGFDFTKRAKGGGIGPDEVDVRLTAGEYVISREAARSLGKQQLDRLNNADRLPKFHSGGAVGLVPGYQAGGAVTGGGGINTVGLVFALQGAASLFATSIEDAASVGAAEMGQGIQGAVSGINLGLVGGEIAGFIPGLKNLAGPIGLVTAAAAGAAGAFISAKNASIDFANKLSKQRIEEATAKISSSFERLSQDVNNLGIIREVASGLSQAVNEIKQQRNREIESGRLSFAGLPEYFFRSSVAGGRTNEQIAAGTSEESLSAQRALVLEMKGFTAYLSTLGGYLGDNQKAQENLSNEIREINRRRAIESSKEFASVADSATKLIEQRLKQGVDIGSIINSAEFRSFAEALARANPEVERFILNTQANTSLTEEEKQRRIQGVVSRRAEIEAIQRTAALRQQIERDNAEKIGRSLETVLSRVFQGMEQAFNATASQIEANFASIDLGIGALSGRATVGLGSDRTTSILNNPRAYGLNTFDTAVDSLKPLLGAQSDNIANMAKASADIEGEIVASINRAIQGNPEANAEAIARIVNRDIAGYAADFDLPSDIVRTLQQQIRSGIEGLRSKGKDKVALDTTDVRESLAGFGQTIDALSGSMKVLLSAQQVYRSALEKYTSVTNKITDLIASRNEYAQRSFEVLANGAIRLNEAFGRVYDAADVRAQETTKIERRTGGISDPREIFNRILDLNLQRRQQQIQLNDAANAGPSGLPRFQELSGELIQTNVELNTLQQALQSLAQSSTVADAALAEIGRVQQQRQQQVGFLESLVTSTPEQLQSLNQAYGDLQRLLSGQTNTINTSIEAQKAYIQTLRQTGSRFQAGQAAQGVLAQERGNVLNLVKEIAPLLGNDREANKLRADVLGRQLSQTGMMTPQFARIIESIRNPDEDPALREAISTYRQAIDLQSSANNYLSNIEQTNATIASRDAAADLQNALKDTVLSVNVINAGDIAAGIQPVASPVARSSGGVIYAAAGQMVDFQPKGTDTVPAMLTPGEFVVNRQATQKNRGLLESINSGKTSYYQYGGYVSPQFKRGVPTSSEKVVDIKNWENFRDGLNDSEPLFTAKSFVAFNERADDLKVSEFLPQTLGRFGVQESPEGLKTAIYQHFKKGASLRPGSVSDLIVERRGEYEESDASSTNYGTASKIAAAVRVVDPEIDSVRGLFNKYPKRGGNISFLYIPLATRDVDPIYQQIADQSNIPLRTVLDYVSDAGAVGERKEALTIYPTPKPGDAVQSINAARNGLYSTTKGASFAQGASTQILNEQELPAYRQKFNQYTTGLSKPNINLKDVPTTAGQGWNQTSGSFYGLYQSLSKDAGQPLGPDVSKYGATVIGGFRGDGGGFTISGKGGNGTVYEANTLPVEQTKTASQSIFERILDHRELLSNPLPLTKEANDFITQLDALYAGADQVPLPGKFFGAGSALTGLSTETYKDFNENARKLRTKKAQRFDLGKAGGGAKRFGLLTDPAQIQKYKDLVRQQQKEEKDAAAREETERQKKLAETDEFVKPEDRRVSGFSLLARYRDMVADSRRFWGPRIYNLPARNEDEARASAETMSGGFAALAENLGGAGNLAGSLAARGFSRVFQNFDSGRLDGYARGNNIDTLRAAYGFIQGDFLANYAGDQGIETFLSKRNIDNARNNIEGTPVRPQDMNQVLDLFADPYQKYNKTGIRTSGLRDIYNTLVQKGVYSKKQRGVLPSVAIASRAYNNLFGWYDGAGPWRGQDGISSDLSAIPNDPNNRKKAAQFLQYRANPALRKLADASHRLLGFGIYGPIPTFEDIKQINGLNNALLQDVALRGINPAPQALASGGVVTPSYFSEGGVALLEKALRVQGQQSAPRNPLTGKSKRYDALTGTEIPFSEFLLNKPGREAVNFDEVDAFATGAARSLPATLAATGIGLSTTGFGAPIGIPLAIAGAIGTGVTTNLLEGLLDPEGKKERDRLTRENPLASTLGGLTTGLGVQGATSKTVSELISGTLRQRLASVGTDFALGEGIGGALGAERSTSGELLASAVFAAGAPGGGRGDEKATKAIADAAGKPGLLGRLFAGFSPTPTTPAQQSVKDTISALQKRLKEEIKPEERLSIQKDLEPFRTNLEFPRATFDPTPEQTAIIQKYQPKPETSAGATGTGGAGQADVSITIGPDPNEIGFTGVAGEKGSRVGRYQLPSEKEILFPQASQQSKPIKDPALEASKERAAKFATEREARLAAEQAAEDALYDKQLAAEAAAEARRDNQLIRFAQEQKIHPRKPPGVTEEAFQDWLKNRKNPGYDDPDDVGYYVKRDVLARAEFKKLQMGDVPNRIPGVDRDLFEYGAGDVVKIGSDNTGRAALQASANAKEYAQIAERLSKERGFPVTIMEAADYVNEILVKNSYPAFPELEPLTKRGLFPTKAEVGTTLAPGQNPGKLLPSGPLELEEWIKLRRLKAQKKATGGIVQPKYLASGGPAGMKPRGTDTVPAMLTPGEFVVNRDAAQKNMGLLQAINRSKGGITPNYLAFGGFAKIRMGGSNIGSGGRRLEPFANLPDNVARSPFRSRPGYSEFDYDALIRAVSTGEFVSPDAPYAFTFNRNAKVLSGGRRGGSSDKNRDQLQLEQYIADLKVNNPEKARALGFSRGGIAPRYLAGGGLLSDDELSFAGSLDTMQRGLTGTREFRLADGVNTMLPEEIGIGMDVYSRRLKNLGANPAAIDFMRSQNFRAGSIYKDPNTPGLAQYLTEKDSSGNMLPGGNIRYKDDNKYGQMGMSLFGHEMTHAVQNFSGTELSPYGSTGNAIDDAAARMGLAGLSSVQEFLKGDSMSGGGYTKSQLTSNLQGELLATLMGQDFMGMTDSTNAMAIQDILRAMGLSKGGRVRYMKTGGQLVDYSPQGTDTIPAMLTPGEFVVNREATQKNLGLLKAINNSKGGKVKNGILYAADGGPTLDETRSRVSFQSTMDYILRKLRELGDGLASVDLPPPQNVAAARPVVQEEQPPTSMSTGPTDCCDRIVTAIQNLAMIGLSAAQDPEATSAAVMQNMTASNPVTIDTTALTQALQGILTPVVQQQQASAQPMDFSSFGEIFASTDFTSLGQQMSPQQQAASSQTMDFMGGYPLDELSGQQIFPQQPTQMAATETTTAPTTVEVPPVDFSAWTNGIQVFGTFVGPLTAAITTLSTVDFGVINNGAQRLETGAQNLGSAFGRFNTAVTSFSQKTTDLINAINGMNLNGTINVQGSISVEPMTVNIAGLEAIETRLNGFAGLVVSTVASALATDNPGFNTTALQASASQFT